jgi:hypothetical protein
MQARGRERGRKDWDKKNINNCLFRDNATRNNSFIIPHNKSIKINTKERKNVNLITQVSVK